MSHARERNLAEAADAIERAEDALCLASEHLRRVLDADDEQEQLEYAAASVSRVRESIASLT